MCLVESFETAAEKRTASSGQVTGADVRCASALIGLMLAYGAVMALLSKGSLAELRTHVVDFTALSFYTGVLLAAVYATVCLVWPAAREHMRQRAFWLVVACILTSLTFPFFAMFKELVLPMRGFVWDRTFAHIGRTLFGVSPWNITHYFFGSVWGTRLLDLSYRWWLPFMFGMPAASAVLFTEPKVRLRILFTWTVSWVLIGTLGGWYFASAGPCYYNTFVASDPDYANLLRRLAVIGKQAAAQGNPIQSLVFQSRLLVTYRTHDFAPGGGISAMPSMHVAMAALITVVGLRLNRWLGAAFAVFGITVWLATVHFGWHYFLDGPVGAFMMLMLWKLAQPVATFAYRERTRSPDQQLGARVPASVSGTMRVPEAA